MTTDLAGGQVIIELLYLIASVLFILSLKWMSSPTSARHGIWAASPQSGQLHLAAKMDRSLAPRRLCLECTHP